MSNWIEERCEAIRLALRIPSFPTEQDLYRLFDWLGGNVVLRHAPTERPRCRFGRSACTVTLPKRLLGGQFDMAACHELGHVLLTKGMGALLRQISDLRAVERLAQKWDLQDEARARRFVMAWYLPSPLCRAFHWDPEQLEWESGCARDMVDQRLRQLRRQVTTLDEAPAWSALRDFHMVAQPSRATPALYVARRGSLSPAYSIPVASVKAVETSAFQVSADLLALNVDEFDTKYDLFRVEAPEALTITVGDLQAWARSA